jgi:CubicO group peptidase (beta-lactamase class C family)
LRKRARWKSPTLLCGHNLTKERRNGLLCVACLSPSYKTTTAWMLCVSDKTLSNSIPSFVRRRGAVKRVTTDAREKIKTLERVAQTELHAVQAPGAEVAVVYGADLLFAKGFGVANSETGAPVTPEMLFRIGSVTKVVTAYGLISLIREQRLSVHAPIGEYVSDLPPVLKPLTIHQLLTHTAGLKDDDSDYGPHDGSALGKAVRRYDNRNFFAEPGKIFSYSGLGYAVAGAVMESISQKPFVQVVSERVLNPLKMERSTFLSTQAMTYPFSQGHLTSASQLWNVVRPYDDNATRWPAGFLFSSAIELARFCIAFMNGGRLDGDQVLSPEVISALAQPYARPLDAPEGQHYGYGLYVGEYCGLRTLEHSGGRRGFCSYLQMFPEQRFAIIELINKANVLLRRTQETAIQQILSPTILSSPPPSPNLVLTAGERDILIGRYAFPDINEAESGEITLFSKDDNLMLHLDDKLMLRLGHKGGAVPVLKRGKARFSIRLSPELQPIEFVFQKGLKRREDYLCFVNRACRRVS